MSDKIKKSYKKTKNIYDDVLTQGKWWSKLYLKLFWSGVNDNDIASYLLKYISDDFRGKILDVPVGTAVFTYKKYLKLKKAQVVCLDYSEDMLDVARKRFELYDANNIEIIQGDVSDIKYDDETFDIVISMNGFHVFSDKEKADKEVNRVLKKGGILVASYYIQGENKLTDWLVENILTKKGWFTSPFENRDSLLKKLEKMSYKIEDFKIEGSMVYFIARKNM